MIVRGKYVLSEPGVVSGGVLTDAAIRVQGDRIVEVASFKTLRKRYENEEVIGNGEQLLMPGLIDGHSHGRGLSPLRGGLGYDQLEPWLLQAPSLPNPGPYLNALYSAIKHLRSGFTGMHYIHIPRLPLMKMERDMEEALAGLNASGIRIAFSVPIKDQNFFTYDDKAFSQMLPTKLKKHLQELSPRKGEDLQHSFVQLFSDFHGRHNSDALKVLLAPAGPQWCSDELLLTVKDLALEHGTSIHLHTLQTIRQKVYGVRTYGKSIVEHLDDIGLLGPDLTLGHAVWLTASDIDLLAAAGTSVTHHAGCNLNMRNGIAPVDAYLRRGTRVALGLDDKSFSEDEDGFQEMRLIALLHRVNTHELGYKCLEPWDVLRMATDNAAQVTGFGGSCGRLVPGNFADVILIDLERITTPWLASDVDIREILVHCGLARDVNTVIVGGSIVMKERELLTVNEPEVLAEFRTILAAQEGESSSDSFWEDLKPYIHAFYRSWGLPETVPFYPFNSNQ